MSARLADDELIITRAFDAPASLLFALWSKPEHMKQWMGPENFTCPEAQIDFRVGGAYRVMITSAKHGESRCNHPPAKPGALRYEPLKAASGSLRGPDR